MCKFEKFMLYLVATLLVISYPWLAFFLILPMLCEKE